MRSFDALLIANRGEIALRVERTARRLGLRTIAVYSAADRGARHVREADAAISIGEAEPRASYLNIGALMDAAQRSGARAVHPGYGFLAESAEFADAVISAGLVWVGPPPAAMRALGDKQRAKRLARASGVSVLPGYDDDAQDEATLARAAAAIGYPLMVKAAAGGGGRGMRLVDHADALADALASARSEAEHAFGDGRLLIERALAGARHVEVQVFADTHGGCVHLGERDCSVQRRHQKLIEESPSPALDATLRARLGAAAVAVARAAGYTGAGTVEFLVDATGDFWFLEMNTRLQVEHPVTELVTGLDLVEWQLRVADGERLPAAQNEIRFQGHAIEARLCAEDPGRDFLPQSGRVALWRAPAGIRVDHALESGSEVSPWYDSLIAKLIAHGETRELARVRLADALDRTIALGIRTNRSHLAAMLRDEVFAAGGATTGFIGERFASPPRARPPATAPALAAALSAHMGGWGEWTSWSNNPARTMRARYACNEEVFDVDLRFEAGSYSAAVAGGSVKLAVLSHATDSARIEIDGASEETIPWQAQGRFVHLKHANAEWTFEDVLHAPPARRAADAGDNTLAAPMNGRVVAVHAKAGDAVQAGQALIVLEAMKMEHALRAPAALTVRVVHVESGAQVAPGQVLVEFQAA